MGRTPLPLSASTPLRNRCSSQRKRWGYRRMSTRTQAPHTPYTKLLAMLVPRFRYTPFLVILEDAGTLRNTASDKACPVLRRQRLLWIRLIREWVAPLDELYVLRRKP